ncbi:MAG: hypothetical protein EAX89_17350, partial [Candidatus Lokiarchaeota archaeon]|nr:hypothetical protein [Candidatus Lokiarchaeota archaeon]
IKCKKINEKGIWKWISEQIKNSVLKKQIIILLILDFRFKLLIFLRHIIIFLFLNQDTCHLHKISPNQSLAN